MALRLSMRSVGSQMRSTGLRAFARATETDEYMVFPRERPGLDYSLNWSLNRNGVTPLGDAYRWTKIAEATKYGATAEKVEENATSAPEATETGSDGLGFEEFDTGLAQAKKLLTSENTLFVAEGESPDSSRTPCRVISDSPTIAATAITGILSRMPRPRDAVALPITCYVTEQGDSFSGFVIEAGDGVVYDENDMVASVVMTGGSYTPGKLSATISRAAAALME